jgi:hypothetical protein
MTTHTARDDTDTGQARPSHRNWQAPGPHLAQLTTYPSRPGLVTSWLHPPPPALPVAIRLTLTRARSGLQPQACKSTIESVRRPGVSGSGGVPASAGARGAVVAKARARLPTLRRGHWQPLSYPGWCQRPGVAGVTVPGFDQVPSMSLIWLPQLLIVYHL